MPTTDDLDFLAMAREMIAEEGRIVSIGILDDSQPDPTKPWKGSGTTPTFVISYEVPVVNLPDGTRGLIGGSGFGRMDFMVDTLFQSSQKILLVAQPDDPDNNFLFCNIVQEQDGSRWKIHARKDLVPGDTPILYAIGVNR